MLFPLFSSGFKKFIEIVFPSSFGSPYLSSGFDFVVKTGMPVENSSCPSFFQVGKQFFLPFATFVFCVFQSNTVSSFFHAFLCFFGTSLDVFDPRFVFFGRVNCFVNFLLEGHITVLILSEPTSVSLSIALLLSSSACFPISSSFFVFRRIFSCVRALVTSGSCRAVFSLLHGGRTPRLSAREEVGSPHLPPAPRSPPRFHERSRLGPATTTTLRPPTTGMFSNRSLLGPSAQLLLVGTRSYQLAAMLSASRLQQADSRLAHIRLGLYLKRNHSGRPRCRRRRPLDDLPIPKCARQNFLTVRTSSDSTSAINLLRRTASSRSSDETSRQRPQRSSSPGPL